MHPASERGLGHSLGHALCRAHDPGLVERLHIDLQRTSSAVCRPTR